ncbi:hypothetical protein GCK32_018832, partial [Trichostrongylus colubriformis]
VAIKTFAFDFGVGSLEDYEPLLEALDKVEVGILVNNVGMGYEYPEILHELEGGLESVRNITTINTLPVTIVSSFLIVFL